MHGLRGKSASGPAACCFVLTGVEVEGVHRAVPVRGMLWLNIDNMRLNEAAIKEAHSDSLSRISGFQPLCMPSSFIQYR